jgi:hypothetical protein
MTLKNYKPIAIIALSTILFVVAMSQSGCRIYRFKDVSIPDTVHTVKVNYIENKASYINPQVSPKLTDKVRQQINSQTRLKLTNGDDADWEINCTITGYSFSTAGISNQQVNTNRLNVTIKVEVFDRKSQKTSKNDVSRTFDYDGRKSLQQAEQDMGDDMIKTLSDDIFTKIFSNW